MADEGQAQEGCPGSPRRRGGALARTLGFNNERRNQTARNIRRQQLTETRQPKDSICGIDKVAVKTTPMRGLRHHAERRLGALHAQ